MGWIVENFSIIIEISTGQNCLGENKETLANADTFARNVAQGVKPLPAVLTKRMIASLSSGGSTLNAAPC